MQLRWSTVVVVVSSLLVAAAAGARADTTPQSVPFAQDWSTSPVTVDAGWANVPGIVGYSGADLIPNAGGVSPADILADASVDAAAIVIADRVEQPGAAGGIVEVNGEQGDPIIAMSGSSQIDAPHLVITLDTTGITALIVSYTVVDLDRTGNVEQAVALQARAGTAGPFTNVPAAFVADATAGPNQAGLRTPVFAIFELPAGTAITQLRIITANALGGDEWIGIDDLVVLPGHPPTAIAVATPTPAGRHVPVTLLATVTPGTTPASTELVVGCDVSAFGLDATLQLFDDGLHDDGLAGDLVFGRTRDIPPDTAYGVYPLQCRVRDSLNRVTGFVVDVTVAPWCDNGEVEPTESCEDGNADDGDGCDDSCDVEDGWLCTPDGCTDIDECVATSDDCVDGAACINQVASYTCACPAGFVGDGHAWGTGCTDVDECVTEADDCDFHAACTNLPGGFACACEAGWSGDGHTSGSGCADVDECADMADDCSPDATCTNESGAWACACLPGFVGDGITCSAVCGDGLVVGDETCDDGDDRDDGAGDGCAACAIEAGWTCTGAPSVCEPMTVDPEEPPGGGCAAGGGGAGALLLILLASSGLLRSGRGARSRRRA